MPDGELRRPPQLWEQRLSRLTSSIANGLSSSGDATAIVDPTPTPGTDSGVEPAPVLPPPGDFIAPSTPTLIGGVQSISVIWNGLNSAGDLWPSDTSWVDVHMSTAGTGFTPGTATLKGRLVRPGAFNVGGLTAATTYHFRLQGRDPSGGTTAPSAAASGQTGLTTSSDYGTATIGTGAVSFNARTIGGVTNTVGAVQPSSPLQGDVWLDSSPGTAIIHKIYDGTSWVTNAWGSASIAAGQITALQIAAGAITAGAIAADAITGKTITGGTITGAQVTGGTIAGGFISGGTVSAGFISGGTVNAAVYTGGSISSSTFTGGTIAGNITATGTVSGAVLTGGTISGGYITGGTISGGFMTGGTIEGASLRTSAGNSQIQVRNSVAVPFGSSDAIDFFGGGTSKAQVTYNNSVSAFVIYSNDIAFIDYNNLGTVTVDVEGDLNVTDALTVDGAFDANGNSTFGASGGNAAFRVQNDDVFSYGIEDNTTASAANVRVGASAQLLKSTSTVRLKDELAPIGDSPLADIPTDKVTTDPASVDPYDVLTLTPTEFRSLSPADADARSFGFIAEDVAAKFPWAANWDEQGLPSAVEDRPIIAALVAVIQDLRSRIEALEAQ